MACSRVNLTFKLYSLKTVPFDAARSVLVATSLDKSQISKQNVPNSILYDVTARVPDVPCLSRDFQSRLLFN